MDGVEPVVVSAGRLAELIVVHGFRPRRKIPCVASVTSKA